MRVYRENTKNFEGLEGFSTSFFGVYNYPFGMLLPGRNGNSQNYDYGFNGMLKDDEIKNQTGTSYDFGARMYDPRVGRFLSLDAYNQKYPDISAYSMARNSPMNSIDVDGDSIIVLIWETGKGYGHAAIAIQNYKDVIIYSYKILDRTVDVKIRVPDGTYTYYDLWPGGEGVGNDKTSTSTPIEASYQQFKTISNGTIITEKELLSTDPSRQEGYLPEGVIKINTTREMDGAVKTVLEQHRNNHPEYVGSENNCSDYVREGVERVYKYTDKVEKNFGKEYFYGNTFSTPNELFNDLKNKVEETGTGEVLRENGSFDKPFIDNNNSGGVGKSSPAPRNSQSGKPRG